MWPQSQPNVVRSRISTPIPMLALAFALLGACVKSHSVPLYEAPPPAPEYTSATTAGGVWVDDRELAQALQAAAERTRPQSPPLPDGRLAQLAAHLGRRLGPTGMLPPQADIDFFARRLGIFEPAVGAFVLAQGETRAVADKLNRALTERAGRRPLTHYGMAPIRSYGASLWVVVWTERRLHLESLPRTTAPGQPLRIRGKLGAGFENPRVRVVHGNGTEKLPAGAGPGFELQVPTQQPGVYEVEISAEHDGAHQLLAVMPVYVGLEPPDEPPSGGQPQNADQVEQSAIAALQQARRTAGLPALHVNPALSEVARKHSAAMAEGSFVGHNGKGGSTPADRVRSAGVDAALVLENVGRTRDVLQLQQEFGQHPGQRSAMLHPQVRELGVGVVMVQGGERPIYYVTQLFVGVADAIDLSSAGEVVLEHLNRARAARGHDPLKLDDALTAVAQDGALAYFADPYPSQQVLVDRANAELGEFSIAYERAAAVMTTVHSLAEAATLEVALESGATHVGLAVAQGTRPGGAGQGTALFITLGWGR